MGVSKEEPTSYLTPHPNILFCMVVLILAFVMLIVQSSALHILSPMRCSRQCLSRLMAASADSPLLQPITDTLFQAEHIVKKSRHIGVAFHAASFDQVVEMSEKLKKEHPKARHVAMGYVGGTSPVTERSSDDGEPQGTAGQPVLQAIRGKGMTNTAVLVVRYFGGIKLGAGGLIRAYGQAARDALAEVETEEVIEMSTLKVKVPTGKDGLVFSLASAAGGSVSADHTDGTVYSVILPASEVEEFRTSMQDRTSGAAVVHLDN